jgi:nucleoside-diphosphate kinase
MPREEAVCLPGNLGDVDAVINATDVERGEVNVERTLSIIKPDAVEKGVIGSIIQSLEEGGLRVLAAKTLRLRRKQAEGFYAVHAERPFFGSLCEFMTSGPIVVMVLEGENAIQRNREIMGVTDPGKAEEGSIRKRFGTNIERNAVHGSDAPETAQTEIAYFFAPHELNGLAG